MNARIRWNADFLTHDRQQNEVVESMGSKESYFRLFLESHSSSLVTIFHDPLE